MSKQIVHGACALCGEAMPLVRSHIIPNFMYRPLKAIDGRFHVFSDVSERKPEIKQAGIWEHLLCAECDNVRLQK